MSRKRTRLSLERLEDRQLLTAWGVPWPGQLTVSFVPDGTQVGALQSAAPATVGAVAWKSEILRALQTWAANANINIGLVADGGQANFSHVIELHAKPGQAQVLITAIRDQAIPQVIATYEGFNEEIVLLSETDPNRVSAISFWRSKKDAVNFTATGFAKVSAFLAGYLASPPVRGEYVVAAEINKPLAKK